MKTLLKYALLVCVVSPFLFDSSAMAQRRNTARPNSSAMLNRADEIAAKMAEIKAQYVSAETPKKYDGSALKETIEISNQSGARLIADFYASSKKENVALSPPTMVATFSALTHLGKGKTKEELQKLLFLNGNEKTSFGLLEDFLTKSYGYYINAEKEPEDWREREAWERRQQQKKYQTFGDEYQKLDKELEGLKSQSESMLGVSGGTYDSVGYLLFNSLYGNVSGATQNEYLEKFGTKVEATDFSEAGVKKYNDEIDKIVGNDFFGFGEEESSGGAIKAKEQSIVVCSAMKLYIDWGFIMDQEERPFNFDRGRKNFNFLKGDLQVRNITVNAKIGYLFPVGLTDMILVKCRNGAELKQLAKTIATDGVKIESAGTRLRTVGLYLPYVGFQTKFDFSKYAQTKGLSAPFTSGQAEYALSDGISIPFPCSDARVESLFQVDETGVLLKQISMAEIPMPIARNQRVQERIIIDSPYLMILAERSLGTVLGMTFIANPVFGDGYEEQDTAWSPPTLPLRPELPQRPSAPETRGAFIEKDDNANDFSSNSPPNGNVVNGNVVRQTTVVRGIPGTVRPPFAISQGLRLGIGAVNHPGGGVCVTDVLPDSPGDLADFEVGDVILEINGTPIHNLQDYSKAVDDSPERMDATVVNLNDGRINRTVELRR